MDYFAKYINTHHSNWKVFDKHFVQYSLRIIQNDENLDWNRLKNYFESTMSGSCSEANLEEKIGARVERLENGFEWIRDTMHYLLKRPEPARAEHVTALDFFLMDPHPSLSMDYDRNSFFDLLIEKLEAKEPFPWKEIKEKVKSDIDIKGIRDAHYWASLSYKQYKEEKGE